MSKFIKSFVFAIVLIGCSTYSIITPKTAFAISDEEINKILKAKEIVRGMVNYPDTLVFHEFYTKVRGDIVTLKFTCKNGFGVAETHVMDINTRK
jgi:hypothetical protein